MSNTQVPAVRPPVAIGERGIEIKSLDDAIRFAQGLVQGGLVPRAFEKLGDKAAGAIVGILQAGSELGLPHMYALSNLTFVNGRVGIMGDAARSVVKMRGGLKPGTDFAVEYSGKEDTPEWTCTVTAHRAGADAPVSSSFSLGDAIRAGLCRIHDGRVQARGYGDSWNATGPWASYTKRMMMYRALGFLCRDTFGDVLAGAVLVEELDDYPQSRAPAERDVTPPKEPDPLLADSAKVVGGEVERPSTADGPQEPAEGTSPPDPYAGDAWTALCERASAGELEAEELERIAGELEARPSTRDKNKARLLRKHLSKHATRGARGTAPQTEEPESSIEGAAMPNVADPLEAPAPSAAPEPSEPERDPDTGEVIPDGVGLVVDDNPTTGEPIDADYRTEPEAEAGPFDDRPGEGQAKPAYIDDAQRRHLIRLLGSLGYAARDAAIEYLSKLLGRSVSTTSDITVEENKKLLLILTGVAKPQEEMF